MTITNYILSLLIVILGITSMSAQDLPNRPVPPRLVVDFAGILSASEENALERKLVSFNDTTSNQILVLVTNDLWGHDISDLADRVGDEWGVGQKEFDNGVVVVLKPQTGNSQGDVWISTGYGLGGAIPDITVGKIIDHEMIPHFKRNDYYAGLDAATTVLMELAAGEYTSDEYASQRDGAIWSIPPIIIIIAIIVLISRLSRRSRTIGGRGVSPWTALWIGTMMGGSSSGGWGGSSGGGFGGGGGGFGGFGGGGFGGGGAGGSW